MTIGNAIQRGNGVYVYDEQGRQLFVHYAGSGPDDGLEGYTSSVVNIRRGPYVISYDKSGRQIASKSAR